MINHNKNVYSLNNKLTKIILLLKKKKLNRKLGGCRMEAGFCLSRPLYYFIDATTTCYKYLPIIHIY